VAFAIKVNGGRDGVDVDVDGDAPCFWVLRDVWGTKPQTRKSESVQNAQ
jgi:hypothetical protein